MSDLLAQLYPDHLQTLKARADTALARGKVEHLLIAAGAPRYQFLDDRDYPFAVNPHFKHWLPVTKAPGSWIAYTPGRKPKLIYLQPFDYWHVVPEAPAGYWVEHFDIVIIRETKEALAHLPQDLARCAILGEDNIALDGLKTNNPDAVKPQRWSRCSMRSRCAPAGSGEKRLKSGAITVGYSTSTSSWNAIHANQTNSHQ